MRQEVRAAVLVGLAELLGTPVDLNDVIYAMRAVKDEDELALIRGAVEVTDRIFETLTRDVIRVGVKGRDIERTIDRLLEEYGASKNSFPSDANIQGPMAPPILGIPHHTVEKGTVLSFDFGVVYNGYCSDFGRSVFIGEPTQRHWDIYDLVYRAHIAGCEQLLAGKSCGENADEAARAIFREAGYEKEFIHKLGHSIGLDVHEMPFLAKGERAPFRVGEVYAVEPSLYFPSHSFIRLEDEVLVTETGYEIMSRIAHKPVIIE